MSSRAREAHSAGAWALPFATPVPGLDERILDALAGTKAQGLVDALIAVRSDEIESSSRGLVDFLREWSSGPASFEPAWDVAFGRLEWLLALGGLDASEVAVRVALRLVETGASGVWDADVPAMTARLGGNVLEKFVHVDVQRSSNGPIVRARRCDGPDLTCSWRQGANAWDAPGASKLASVGVRRPIDLLASSSLPPASDDPQGFEGVRPVRSIDATTVRTFARAFEILREVGADYLDWVERVLRVILVCERPESSWMVSGSAAMLPGVVHVSYPAGAMDMADALVHECAHQNFYLLEHLDAFDDGTDDRLYWSAPVRRERPLSKILMAYHAFANVLLFYDALRVAGADDEGYVDRHERRLVDLVAQLDAPLRENCALTELGRMLYTSLADRLALLYP